MPAFQVKGVLTVKPANLNHVRFARDKKCMNYTA